MLEIEITKLLIGYIALFISIIMFVTGITAYIYLFGETMKKLLPLFLMFCCWSCISAQETLRVTIGESFFTSSGYMETDSTAWIIMYADSTCLGNENCQHDWAYDRAEYPGMVCCVIHPPGTVCSMSEPTNKRVCRICKRIESVKRYTYQHYVPQPKSDFEMVIEGEKK